MPIIKLYNIGKFFSYNNSPASIITLNPMITNGAGKKLIIWARGCQVPNDSSRSNKNITAGFNLKFYVYKGCDYYINYNENEDIKILLDILSTNPPPPAYSESASTSDTNCSPFINKHSEVENYYLFSYIGNNDLESYILNRPPYNKIFNSKEELERKFVTANDPRFDILVITSWRKYYGLEDKPMTLNEVMKLLIYHGITDYTEILCPFSRLEGKTTLIYHRISSMLHRFAR